jgi:hypothetical protein
VHLKRPNEPVVRSTIFSSPFQQIWGGKTIQIKATYLEPYRTVSSARFDIGGRSYLSSVKRQTNRRLIKDHYVHEAAMRFSESA